MYYVDGDKILENNNCISYGPPYWYFNRFISKDGEELDLSKIPSNINEIPEDDIKQMEMGHTRTGHHGHVHSKSKNSKSMENSSTRV
jgi:hypothetical protein